MHDETMQLLKGIPIAGAYAEKAAAGLQARQPLTGDGDAGDTFGERYDKNLARETARSSAYEREHPWLSTALNVGGGVAATAPLMAARPLAWALGGAGPMAARIPLGAASGGGISVADALARGNDPTIAAVSARRRRAGPGCRQGGRRRFQSRRRGAHQSPTSSRASRAARARRSSTRNEPDDGRAARRARARRDAVRGQPGTMQLAQGMVAARPGAAQAKIVNAVTDRDAGATRGSRPTSKTISGPIKSPGAQAAARGSRSTIRRASNMPASPARAAAARRQADH
jgi:hypothetical protein